MELKGLRRNKKNIAKVYILIQFLLAIVISFWLKDNKPSIEEITFLSLIFLNSFFMFQIFLFKQNSDVIFQSIILILIASIYITLDMTIYKYSSFFGSAWSVVAFISIYLMIGIITQNLLFSKKILSIIVIFGMMVFFLGLIKSKYYFLLFQVYTFIFSFFPLGYLLFNYKILKKYGRHIVGNLVFIIVMQQVFLTSNFFVSKNVMNTSNRDIYIYLLILMTYICFILVDKKKVVEYIKNYNFNMVSIFIYIYLALNFGLHYGQLKIVFLFILISLVILKETEFYNMYNKYFNQDLNKIISNTVTESIINLKMEELYREKMAMFLHDDILQDILVIKKELNDRVHIDDEDQINQIISQIILKIRSELNLYKPKLNKSISLAENYYEIVNILKGKYKSKEVLIDFECDEKIFLSPPYDVLIYRTLYELVTNIFKHSKGYASFIKLHVENSTIYLEIRNIGDYIDSEIDINKSMGLKIIKSQVSRLRGKFYIFSSPEIKTPNEEIEESTVIMKVEIPIEKEVAYEDFVNRRS